jgi:hypothetical protein
VLEETAVMPPDGTQVGVFGYPGAAKVPLGRNYIFGGPIDVNSPRVSNV